MRILGFGWTLGHVRFGVDFDFRSPLDSAATSATNFNTTKQLSNPSSANSQHRTSISNSISTMKQRHNNKGLLGLRVGQGAILSLAAQTSTSDQSRLVKLHRTILSKRSHIWTGHLISLKIQIIPIIFCRLSSQWMTVIQTVGRNKNMTQRKESQFQNMQMHLNTINLIP
ncbi:hypothetical protein BCR33DRAFT_414564 [Rhizoclosmatium globosum]|uniref:Uncharacterized protein n=1 Tax=Rhizoclosmatium globosum TaxID=329046 RepID=A0A1Y2BXE3_9FUNG|nr:hypothetical protein BCR33DRAFT_414564 [Rhizoclosmatium globosum]|eukprot:ORY39439.1 hypothetical protein BCR33DRAFT_414564 [Rhizoclosmatium globosum]